MNKKESIIIYGSYGYTGKLISELAAKREMNIILSGRDESRLREQAAGLRLPFKTAALDKPPELDELLANAKLVIHCAGPFRRTWKQMLDACIRTNTHYLDITGEIEVFEGIKARDAELKEAGIMAMPGTGFDVVPTDCLALHLKNKLPDAVKLELAFMKTGSGISHGTAQSIAENLGSGGTVRENRNIKRVPSAYKMKEIDFGKGKKTAVSIPWGDVSTAYFTTGIGNITVYTAMKKSAVRLLKISDYLAPLLRTLFVKKAMKKWISNNITGPDESSRETGKNLIWGRVENSQGESAEARLTTPEGYKLTALASRLIAQKVVEGSFSPGYQTPAAVYGENLILEIEGTYFK